MIRCHRKHLEVRCRQRGYRWDEVAACIVSADGDTIVVDETHTSFPRSPKMPSLLTKAANFAAAAVQHVAAGAPLASEEEVARRHDICKGCEFFDGSACSKCGCPIVRERQYISKLSWADQKCPVGKW